MGTAQIHYTRKLLLLRPWHPRSISRLRVGRRRRSDLLLAQYKGSRAAICSTCSRSFVSCLHGTPPIEICPSCLVALEGTNRKVFILSSLLMISYKNTFPVCAFQVVKNFTRLNCFARPTADLTGSSAFSA